MWCDAFPLARGTSGKSLECFSSKSNRITWMQSFPFRGICIIEYLTVKASRMQNLCIKWQTALAFANQMTRNLSSNQSFILGSVFLLRQKHTQTHKPSRWRVLKRTHGHFIYRIYIFRRRTSAEKVTIFQLSNAKCSSHNNGMAMQIANMQATSTVSAHSGWKSFIFRRVYDVRRFHFDGGAETEEGKENKCNYVNRVRRTGTFFLLSNRAT